MTAPRVGDYVRVAAFRGEVVRVWASDGLYRVVGEGRALDCRVEDIVVIPPPEPKWHLGDVVLDSAGAVFLLTEHGWAAPGSSALLPDTRPARPLALLVRDNTQVRP